MRAAAALVFASLFVSACATAATGPWERSSIATEGGEWRGTTYAGELEDPRADLVESCQGHWSPPGPPHAIRLVHTETGEDVVVHCDEVRD